jgi:hypothetical protein
LEGLIVGADVDGFLVGPGVGGSVGTTVGTAVEGLDVGAIVEGFSVGNFEGVPVVGAIVDGSCVGGAEGDEGLTVGGAEGGAEGVDWIKVMSLIKINKMKINFIKYIVLKITLL